MGKKVKVSQNLDAALKTKEIGIKSAIQLVIGMPGEAIETVKETKKFLKAVKYPEASVNYAMHFQVAHYGSMQSETKSLMNVI